MPKEYYSYKLRGIILHTGTLEGGHYHSLVQDRESPSGSEKACWQLFNDTVVQSFDIENLKEEAFGDKEARYDAGSA